MPDKKKKTLLIEPGVLPGKATLDPKAFGRQLILSGDLDPIYIMLARAKLDSDTLARWLVAYTCYYHAGVASFCAEDPKKFWKRLRRGHDEKWPRGSERRHFRGGTSDYVTTWFPQTYSTATEAIEYLSGPDKGRTFKRVSKQVQTWKYFGSWIAFKWADLLERVMQIDVDFSDCELDFYDGPTQGAKMVAEYYGTPDLPVSKVVSRMTKAFSDLEAPPWKDRPIGIQEVETVLCKWKSHCNGHYPVGKDTREIREGLHGWGDLAERLATLLPKQKAI